MQSDTVRPKGLDVNAYYSLHVCPNLAYEHSTFNLSLNKFIEMKRKHIKLHTPFSYAAFSIRIFLFLFHSLNRY